MLDVTKLYPQYYTVKDRRTQSEPVAFERRCGRDRRSEDRVYLDTKLTKDIFEVRSKVNQAQKSSENKTDNISFKQNIAKAAINSVKTDQFIKSGVENANNFAKSPKKTSSAVPVAGALMFALGGVLAATTFGPVGAGVAVAIGACVGAKAVSEGVRSHLKKK